MAAPNPFGRSRDGDARVPHGVDVDVVSRFPSYQI
jgi:hypothetical protein